MPSRLSQPPSRQTHYLREAAGEHAARARRAAEAAACAGVKHIVMFNYRLVPAVAHARQAVESGRLGRIHHYRCAYLQDWIVDSRFPLNCLLQQQYAGAGTLGDNGSHAVDTALWLSGEIVAVTAMLTTFVKERPADQETTGEVTVDDDTNFLARFRNGSVGVFEMSRFCTGRRNANIEIYTR